MRLLLCSQLVPILHSWRRSGSGKHAACNAAVMPGVWGIDGKHSGNVLAAVGDNICNPRQTYIVLDRNNAGTPYNGKNK